LSGIILLIGYIMAAFDPERRALHDRICNTRVVLK
ncbi:MAG: RDD family protein, partial [Acidobacteria bacterium]